MSPELTPAHDTGNDEELILGLRSFEVSVLREVDANGSVGATYWEIQVALGSLPQSTSPACTVLREAGLIARNGHRRPSQTGALCYVYVSTDRGRRLLASLAKAVAS